MKQHVFTLLFIVSTSLSAQTKRNGCNNLWLKTNYTGLQEAKSHESKALTIIKNAGVHDTVIAKAHTTAGICMDFFRRQDNAITHYTKALSYLKEYPALQIYVYINLAVAYEIKTDYGKSVAISKKALALNDKYGTPVTQALLHQTLGNAYLRTDKLDLSTDYLLKGIAILQKQKDACYIPFLKLSLANTYIQTNNYTFAIDLFEDYLQNNTHAKGSKIYTIAVVNYTECLITLNRHDKALSLLTAALPDVQKTGDKELEAVLYSRLASLEDRRDHTESSLGYYKKAYELLNREESKFATQIFEDYLTVLNKAKRHKDALALTAMFKNSAAYRKSTSMERMGYEQTVAGIYESNKNYTESTIALKEALRLCDSIRQTNNGYNEQELQARYQTKFQQERNRLLAKHNKALNNKLITEERLLLMYILASLAAVTVILLYLRGYRLRNRLQKERLKNMEADKAFIQQQHLHEQELTASQKNTIEEKQREATSIALQLANYYDNLNQLIEKCNTPGYTTANDIKKELLQLVKQKDYWKQFETRFNDLNPEFASTLMHNYPKLTKNDIEFCSLLKLKLSYKEIASLLQISHESVITKKYRVRKKMELQDEVEFEKMLDEM